MDASEVAARTGIDLITPDIKSAATWVESLLDTSERET